MKPLTQALVVELLSRYSLKDGVKKRMEPSTATYDSIRELFDKAEQHLRDLGCHDARVQAARGGKMLAWEAGVGQVMAGWSGHKAEPVASMSPVDLARYVDLLDKLKTVAEEHTSKQKARTLISFAKASVESEGEVSLTTPKKALPPVEEAKLPPLPPKGEKPKKTSSKPVKAEKPEKPPKPTKSDKKALQEVLGGNPFEQDLKAHSDPYSLELPASAKRRKGVSGADPNKSGSPVLPDRKGKARGASCQ